MLLLANIMKTLLSITISLFFIHCFGQTKQQKLIIAEYQVSTPGLGKYTYLVSYNFSNGILVSKDTLLGAETHKKGLAGSYVRFDLGNNFIYKNRYVISAIGNVIDLKTKGLIIEEHDDFVDASGDTLIFHRNNFYQGTGYLMLNLNSGKYTFLNNKERNKEKEERSSPNKMYYLSIDKSETPYKIWLCDPNDNRTLLVRDAGHGPIYFTSELPTIETHWLDNSSYLYAVHQANSKPGKNAFSRVTLRRFNIHSKSDKVFAVLDSVGKGYGNASFYFDKKGQTIYQTSDGRSYLIDTTNSKLTDYEFYEAGYNFSISGKSTKTGHIIKYKHETIGTEWSSNEVVSDGIIAMAYGDARNHIYYSRGVKVWSNITKTWTTIDIPWLSRVIGWVNEE